MPPGPGHLCFPSPRRVRCVQVGGGQKNLASLDLSSLTTIGGGLSVRHSPTSITHTPLRCAPLRTHRFRTASPTPASPHLDASAVCRCLTTTTSPRSISRASPRRADFSQCATLTLLIIRTPWRCAPLRTHRFSAASPTAASPHLDASAVYRCPVTLTLGASSLPTRSALMV